MARGRRPMRTTLAGALLAGSLIGPVWTVPAEAADLPANFQEQIVFTGLDRPTDVEFAPDGRVFVAEKGGRIKIFDNLSDSTPTVFADLSTNVNSQWDRGLVGLALPPTFPTNPWVYALYTYDGPPGQTAPVWNDACGGDGNTGTCVVTGRLSRMRAAGNMMSGSEQVLIHDWCQQFQTHSVGDVRFGPDGMLYVSAGDGAGAHLADYGNLPASGPTNPCADPPGGPMAPPAAEGGALRSQDVRTTADPTGLDGTILRLDPETGAAAPGNPMGNSADPNTRRVYAYGVRNPYRFTFRPGTGEIWFGDVGWNTWEEVNRLTVGGSNFGWPCYEGTGRQAGYDSADLTLCESLYATGDVVAPYYSYDHGWTVQGCGGGGGSSVTGVAFYPGNGTTYPAQYQGALFFADYARGCIWAMPRGADGLPDASRVERFVGGAASPVDLEMGPGDELYYADILGGTVRRVRYFPGNQPPTASLSAVPTSGSAPLTVNFSATGSTDPDPADAGLLSFAWDFTNDGSTDATGPTASFVYAGLGNHTARLTVTDTLGASDTRLVQISVGNTAPTAVIDSPAAGTQWRVGDTVSFTGHATDPQQGDLPAAALSWRLRLQHCVEENNCHTHFLQDWTGVASGAFTAPDHEYPSYLELELVATDADGLTHNTVRRLDPHTVTLTFASDPPGLALTVGSGSQATPFTRTLIQGSTTTVSAPTPQSSGATTYAFGGWSDGGAQTHVITAPTTAATWTASYTGSTPSCVDSFGHTCTDGPRTFLPADTDIGLNGDDISKQITLPFPLRFYGQTYTSAWVDTNGVFSFAPLLSGPSTWNQSAIPSPAEDHKANLALYPFWSDLDVDGQSTVLSRVLGSAPERTFVVEWRNVTFYADRSARVSFQIQYQENGTITFAYTGIDSNATEQGAVATVGIENGDGTVAIQYAFNQPVLRNGHGVTFTPPGGGGGEPPPGPASVSGVVTSDGAPAAGVTVTLAGQSVTTGSGGGYTFGTVTPGSYTVSASLAGRCATRAASAPVTVTAGGSHTVNLALAGAQLSDSFGHTCSDGPRTFVPADQTVLALTGDDISQQITLPFPLRFYGQTYTSAWVDTNGVFSFAPLLSGPSTWNQSAIPSPAEDHKANLAVYPFWSDLIVDGAASVRTAVLGSAPERRFVVEWRNVTLYADQSRRLSFEIIYHEDGTIVVTYQGIDDNLLEQGSAATVGIENANGTVALSYAFNQTALRSGQGVTFLPPGGAEPPPAQSGTIAGVVSADGSPLAGVTVTVSGQSTTTAADGSYTVTGVAPGAHTVSAAQAGRCATRSDSAPVTVTAGGTHTVNLSLTGSQVSDSFGHTCTEGARAFVPADTDIGLSGDDISTQITLPFPLRFYGQTYTSAWVDTNGVFSFAPLDTAPSTWDQGPIPSPAAAHRANLALYPFWGDLDVDGPADVLTAVVGQAPHRRFIVEWRNVTFYADHGRRVSFEIIYDEDGTITFAYQGIDNHPLEQGSAATIGIENANGTVAVQYSCNATVVRSGQGVTFHPPAP